MTPLQEILEQLANKSLFEENKRHIHVTQALTAIAGVVEECIGPDEPDIPMESMRPDGTQMVQINPRNQVRQEIRNNLREKGLL